MNVITVLGYPSIVVILCDIVVTLRESGLPPAFEMVSRLENSALEDEESERVLLNGLRALLSPLLAAVFGDFGHDHLGTLKGVLGKQIVAVEDMRLDALNLEAFEAELAVPVSGRVTVEYTEANAGALGALLLDDHGDTVDVGWLGDVLDPLRVGWSFVRVWGEAEVEQATILHVASKETERPVGGLEEETFGARHEWRDDVDTLSNARNTDILGLADEDVEPCYNTKHVSVVVRLLETLRAWCLDFVPNVPFVIADLDVSRCDLLVSVVPVEQRLGLVNLGQVDERSANFDTSFRCCRTEDILLVVEALNSAVVFVTQHRVEMNRVEVDHTDQAVQHFTVPLRVALVTARDELDGRIDELHAVCPSFGHLGVVGCIEEADLPWAVHLVSETPVLDVVRLITTCVLASEIGQ